MVEIINISNTHRPASVYVALLKHKYKLTMLTKNQNTNPQRIHSRHTPRREAYKYESAIG